MCIRDRDTAEPEEYDDENIYDYEDEEEMDTDDRKFFGKKNKVVSMPQQQAQKMCIRDRYYMEFLQHLEYLQ